MTLCLRHNDEDWNTNRSGAGDAALAARKSPTLRQSLRGDRGGGPELACEPSAMFRLDCGAVFLRIAAISPNTIAKPEAIGQIGGTSSMLTRIHIVYTI